MIAAAKPRAGSLEQAAGSMKLARTSIYALHATLLLARFPPGIPISCKQIAREGKLPERFLLQILGRLVKADILQSTCGVAGGYYLARSPGQISLDDIVNAADRPTPRKAPNCELISPNANDLVTETLVGAAVAVRVEFRKLSLAALLETDEAVCLTRA